MAIDLARAETAIAEFLSAIGAPVDSDPELRGTPKRVALAYAEELLAGYAMNPAQILGDSTASTSPGMVIVKHISAATMCPHHLLPARGVVHVGYVPGTRVVGLGALGKLVDCFTQRLALQEDIGDHITAALITHLGAQGAGCIVDFEPTCLTLRGEKRHGARAITESLAGSFRIDASVRDAFLRATTDRAISTL